MTARSNNFKLYLVIAICAAPVIASYLVYFFVRPDARTNYGDLIEPQRPIPALHLQTLDGRAFDATSLKGKWMMLMVADGTCADACKDRLYHLRQVRLTTGKDRDRIARVWLIPDREPLSTMVIREYDGTEMLRANQKEIAAWLDGGDRDGAYREHIYIVDPLGNLMMRFPVNADPNKTKRDLAKLLRASRIG
jgi:hypothetical protein